MLVFSLCVLALCFELACVSDLCFGLGGLVFRAGFLFRAWVSVCGFDVWVNGFGFGGFQRLVVADFVAVGLFCGALWVCFMVAVGLLVMLCWCLGGGRATFFFFFNFFCDW